MSLFPNLVSPIRSLVESDATGIACAFLRDLGLNRLHVSSSYAAVERRRLSIWNNYLHL